MDAYFLALATAGFEIVLGFIIWLIQRQITQNAKANSKAHEVASEADKKERERMWEKIKEQEERVRVTELQLKEKVTREDLDVTLDRALEPITNQMNLIQQSLAALNSHLLGGGR